MIMVRGRLDPAVPGPLCALLPLLPLPLLLLPLLRTFAPTHSSFYSHIPTMLPKFQQQNRFVIDIAAGLHHR